MFADDVKRQASAQSNNVVHQRYLENRFVGHMVVAAPVHAPRKVLPGVLKPKRYMVIPPAKLGRNLAQS